MTDKEKRELKDGVISIFNRFNILDHAATIGGLRDDVLRYIDSLQEEPVSENFKIALEKKVREAQDWTYIEEEGCECPLNEEFGAYDLEEFAMWGANWQKEQMMAKAVDAVVKIDAGGYPYVDRTIELYDYDKDIPLAKRGDKVKVLVIKED